MSEGEDEPVPDAPATWENVVVGKAEELLGKVTRDDAVEAEGEERAEIAHEVRKEWDEEREH